MRTIGSPVTVAPLAASALLTAIMLLAGCADSRDTRAGGAAWAGTIDTVGGKVVVRNPREPLRGANEVWEIVPELRIGTPDGTGPDLFGRISALAISAAGEIAVLDGQALEVRLFDREGRHLWTVGRRGGGPGEFNGPTAMHFDSRGRLWVTDVGNARYSIFGSDGGFEGVRPRQVGGVVLGNAGVLTAADELIDLSPRIEPGRAGTLPIRIALETWKLDTLPPLGMSPIPATPSPAALSPFSTRTAVTFDSHGAAWLAQTDAFVLHLRAPAGDTVRVIEWDTPPRRFAAWEEDSIASVIRDWSFPVDRGALRVAPQLIRSLHVDDAGQLYVRRAPVDLAGGTTIFETFDSVGRYLGPVHSTIEFARYPAPSFRGDAVYGIMLDELGIPYVVRGRIVAREAAGE